MQAKGASLDGHAMLFGVLNLCNLLMLKKGFPCNS